MSITGQISNLQLKMLFNFGQLTICKIKKSSYSFWQTDKMQIHNKNAGAFWQTDKMQIHNKNTGAFWQTDKMQKDARQLFILTN